MIWVCFRFGLGVLFDFCLGALGCLSLGLGLGFWVSFDSGLRREGLDGHRRDSDTLLDRARSPPPTPATLGVRRKICKNNKGATNHSPLYFLTAKNTQTENLWRDFSVLFCLNRCSAQTSQFARTMSKSFSFWHFRRAT